MEIEDYISKLDSDRFGIKIAKVNDYSIGVNKVLAFLKDNKVDMILTKIDANNIDLINELERNLFQIKDIQVTYKFDLKNYCVNRSYENSDLIIRDATLDDIHNLEEIALDSFWNYGHYSADDRLDKAKSNEIYKDWIRRSVENSNVADKIIVAEYNRELAGFLSFMNSKAKPLYTAGGLGAVSKNFRNKNIFRIINIEGLNYAKENDLEWVEHNVLITNLPVNKAYTNLGFAVYKSFITMHCWL